MDGTDYTLNETTGDLELVVPGLALDDSLVICGKGDGTVPGYSFYTGLIQETQKVINGVPPFTTYPGVRAAGVKMIVASPIVQIVNIIINITAIPGVAEETLYDAVSNAVQAYVNNLRIAEDVVVSELEAAALSVVGVYDTNVISPSSNLLITDGHLARTTSGSVSVV